MSGPTSDDDQHPGLRDILLYRVHCCSRLLQDKRSLIEQKLVPEMDQALSRRGKRRKGGCRKPKRTMLEAKVAGLSVWTSTNRARRDLYRNSRKYQRHTRLSEQRKEIEPSGQTALEHEKKLRQVVQTFSSSAEEGLARAVRCISITPSKLPCLSATDREEEVLTREQGHEAEEAVGE